MFSMFLKTCQILCQLSAIYYSIHKIIIFLCIILDYKNSKFKYLIDDITIVLWSYWKFTSIEDIRRMCNSMVDLSKFIINKKNILSRVVALNYYNQVCYQILSKV